jgi:hypothetical protein
VPHILDQPIEEERRRRFVEEANCSYARVRENSALWLLLQAERDLWEVTLLDGLSIGRNV